MERSGLTRWLLLGLIVFAAITFLPKMFGGGGTTDKQPLKAESTLVPVHRSPERMCDIWGERFRAQIGSHGASIAHFELTTAKYVVRGTGQIRG